MNNFYFLGSTFSVDRLDTLDTLDMTSVQATLPFLYSNFSPGHPGQ
jgi:hypothetical protein